MASAVRQGYTDLKALPEPSSSTQEAKPGMGHTMERRSPPSMFRYAFFSSPTAGKCPGPVSPQQGWPGPETQPCNKQLHENWMEKLQIQPEMMSES